MNGREHMKVMDTSVIAIFDKKWEGYMLESDHSAKQFKMTHLCVSHAQMSFKAKVATIATGARMPLRIGLAGNVGVVSGIFSPQNNRHADMSAPCCRHDTDHVGDIAPCQLAGRCVDVVLACVNCDVSVPCR
jgi:hypothetical protein